MRWVLLMHQCPKCGRNYKSYVKALREYGMCTACHKVWTKPSFDETLAAIEPAVYARIRELYRMGLLTVRVLSTIRAEFGRKIEGGRDWDDGIIIMADERAKAQERADR